ncbi:hypothetical protein [Cupriavidus sp. AcVe19-6a]|uniref:hypothetical protein n=1 Tax=Cupriavidus sp. AcVe19-6a TaxID=2821358 RepID=UPI001AE194DC|nr:hypothetical protein [Cupriavidus sp. AcVe19-6a]MBP0639190.1 hypothetical protein [Cupriavidus sp. AcVe19-6a]
MIEDQTAPDPFTTVADKGMRELVATMLSAVTPDEATVLRCRFGIGGARGGKDTGYLCRG